MHEFAEEYVANLKPRDERYDTRLGDDFYVATFPNGVKTWAYVFQVNGYTRRQTLGIYPEMPLAQALESLYSARHTRAVETDLASQGMDGTQVRKTEDSPINLTAKMRVPKINLPKINPRFLAGVATGSVVTLIAAAAGWMFLAPVVVEVPAAVATAVTVIEQQPDTIASVPVPVPDNPENIENTVAVEQQAQPVAVPVTPSGVVASAEPTIMPTAAPGSSVTESAEGSAEAADELGASQKELRKLQQDLAGTLAWAQLTSDVRNGEPVDQLSWVVELDHAPRRIFYFVRVRGLAGGTVTYRWRHQGKLMKEDSVKVGQGWHSPAYSAMTLTEERLGRWQVEVFGPGGQPLGSEEFETRIVKETPQLSRR